MFTVCRLLLFSIFLGGCAQSYQQIQTKPLSMSERCNAEDGQACYRLALEGMSREMIPTSRTRRLLERACEYRVGKACIVAAQRQPQSPVGRQKTKELLASGCRFKESRACIMLARFNFLASQSLNSLEAHLKTLTSLCDRQSPSACIGAIRGHLVLGLKVTEELVGLGIHGCRHGASEDLTNDCERLYQLGCSLSAADCIQVRKGSTAITDACAKEDMRWVATRTFVARQMCRRNGSKVVTFEFGVEGQLLENKTDRRSCLHHALKGMRLIPNRPKRVCRVQFSL